MVNVYFPGDPGAGFAEGSGHGAIFCHGEFAGLDRLIGIDRAFQVESDVNVVPQGGFPGLFALGIDGHMKSVYGLALFVENGDDVDAAATPETHQEHLHGTYAETLSAGLAIAVHADDMARSIPGFETKITADPFQLNTCHFIFFANLRCVWSYFASNYPDCMNYFTYEHPFELEGGGSLPGITVAYHTYGRMDAEGGNVVWVCHALTANSDAAGWWPGVVGEKGPIHPDKYFIVCANILGSCYGTTGPLSTDPLTAVPYYTHFPSVTIRDMVRAHMLLREHLGIDRIHLLMGGSMGGYQALEWSVMEPRVVERLFLIATSPSESAWGIAVHTAQRLAIEADDSWREASPGGGSKGLKAARAIGILTYRNYGIMVQKQSDPDVEKLDGFRASSYIEYQGDKLVSRFNAYCYWLLTKAMDSHQLARGRGGDMEAVLKSIAQPTLVIGVVSDILCPLEEQRHIVEHLPNARLIGIDSAYGHDGFMVEGEKIATHLRAWLSIIG